MTHRYDARKKPGQRPDHRGYEISSRQVAWGCGTILLIIIAILYLVLSDNEISVQKTQGLLASVPVQCREQARQIMLETLSTNEEIEYDDLQKSVEPVIANCSLIGALANTN